MKPRLRIWSQITSLFHWIRIFPFVLSLSKDGRKNPGASLRQTAHPSTSSRQPLHALLYLLHPCSRGRTVWREMPFREVIFGEILSVVGKGMGDICGVDELDSDIDSTDFPYQPVFGLIESELC